MRYLSTLAVAGLVVASAMTAGAAAFPERSQGTVDVVMKDKGFRVTSGDSERGFMLVAGTQADINLRNDDTVAHEFVSPLLYKAPFQISGNATLIRLPNTMGVRIDPGQSAVLTFNVPQDSTEFQPLYDLFWCNIHGKQHSDSMRGEILIVETRGEVGGG
jgi:hypothetical protein